MNKRLLSVWMLLLLAGLWCIPLPAALAEDCFTLHVDTLDLDRLNSDAYVASHLSSSAQGIRICKQVSQSSETAVPVRLTLTQMNTRTLVFDKEYGYVGGSFDSGVIYLPYVGEHTAPYLITLYAGDYTYGLPFMHTPRRLNGISACTDGARLRDLDASLGGDWMMGTMLDLDALRQTGRMNIDLCASGSYLIGTAYVTLSGGSLCVDLSFHPSANASLDSHSLYVVTDCASFHSAPAYSIGQWIDLSGASSALLYLPMTVSFDPAGLPAFYYDRAAVQNQLDLWNRNCDSASGGSAPSSGWNEDSAWDDGWNDDGWHDPNYGWDDEWSSDAPGWQG